MTKYFQLLNKYITTSLIWLIVVVIIAIILRGNNLLDYGNWFNFKYFLHTHSHLAFLGWIFNAIYFFYIYKFNLHSKKVYKYIFYSLNLTVFGMLVTFPIQGYALYSIVFSSLHTFISFIFCYFFINDTNHISTISRKFAVASLFFMIVSSIGPFSLGPIIALGYKHTIWYDLAIYFYLHFQYNGLFLFALLSIFTSYNISLESKVWNKFFWILFYSTIFNYSLSTLWTEPGISINIIAFLSSLVQLYAIYIIRNDFKKILNSFNKIEKYVLSIITFLFVIKVLSMTIGSIQEVAMYVYYNRNLVIGYLHLIFLGIVTPFLLFNIIKLSNNKKKIVRFNKQIIVFICLFLLNANLLFMTSLQLGNQIIFILYDILVYETLLMGMYLIFISANLIVEIKNLDKIAEA